MDSIAKRNHNGKDRGSKMQRRGDPRVRRRERLWSINAALGTGSRPPLRVWATEHHKFDRATLAGIEQVSTAN